VNLPGSAVTAIGERFNQSVNAFKRAPRACRVCEEMLPHYSCGWDLMFWRLVSVDLVYRHV
jgi:hypothetical protein